MNKLLTVGVASLAIAGVVGIASVNASAMNGSGNGTGSQTGTQLHDGSGNGNGNGRQTSLESRATALGMSVVDLEKALETKTMSQIAVDKGMSETDFEAKMQAAAEARWETRGLSSEEIATRTADREERHATNSADHEFGSGDGNRQGGYRQNR